MTLVYDEGSWSAEDGDDEIIVTAEDGSTATYTVSTSVTTAI